MAISKISANMIDGSMTSSLVTGTLPAVSGVALLNAGAGIDTETTSDPLITTNPSGGVGTLWLNTTSGELFNCQSATTDANVWVNIGTGDDNITSSFGGLGGGKSFGFTAGGAAPTQDTIEKFHFASNSGGVDHGNLVMGRSGVGGCSSATDGYVIGGYVNGPPGGVGGFRENIDRFSFTSNTTATDHGDLTRDTGGCVGCSSSTNGYAVSGHRGPSNAQSNIIDTFTFGSNSNATDHGDMSMAGRARSGGHSSLTDGYVSGGETPGPPSVTRVDIIDKFAFASNTTASDHGDISVTRSYVSGQSSNTHGFTSGGYTGSVSNVIDKFTFGSSNNSTDHADLSVARSALAGQSSTTHGYCSAGYNGAHSNIIDKFAFASTANATDHGDLIAVEDQPTGHQY
jgi:hypothetical protein